MGNYVVAQTTDTDEAGMVQKGEHTMEPQMIPGVGLWISAMDTEGNRFSILRAQT